MESIELYLSPADDGGQTLEDGLDPGALAETGAAPETEDAGAKTFRDPGGDPNDLADQGWAVVAPRGERGDRLLALMAPLLAKRAEDQQADVVVHRVPPAVSASQAMAWLDRKLVGNQLDEDIPGYLLILGELDEVSLEFQQVLSTECHVGRLGFDDDAGYEAYANKLLGWERARASAAAARALFFCARDGTAATELGHRLLVRPTVADAQAQRERGKFPVAEIVSMEDPDPVAGGNALLEAAAAAQPSILMSCSHGMGAPRRGWRSFDRQRALQGALCLGQGEAIDAGSMASQTFLPGGMWMFFACFGAGTPASSAYHHWLARLRDMGAFGGSIDAVLASLSAAGNRPFLGALPKAVLRNPNGPLAVIGHLDLAWSYSFQDLDKASEGERHRRFQGLLGQMSRGSRAGLALSALLRAREQVKTDLTIAADGAARAGGAALPREQLRLGHRWMLHQDLDGYVLLGDPAARLAVDPKQAARPRPEAPAPQTRVRVEAAPQARVGVAAAPAAPHLDLDTMEAIVHALIAGDEAPAALASKHGVDKRLLREWERVYMEAGRAALAKRTGG